MMVGFDAAAADDVDSFLAILIGMWRSSAALIIDRSDGAGGLMRPAALIGPSSVAAGQSSVCAIIRHGIVQNINRDG